MRQVVVVPAGAVKAQVTVLDEPGDAGPPVMTGAGGAVRSSVNVLEADRSLVADGVDGPDREGVRAVRRGR